MFLDLGFVLYDLEYVLDGVDGVWVVLLGYMGGIWGIWDGFWVLDFGDILMFEGVDVWFGIVWVRWGWCECLGKGRELVVFVVCKGMMWFLEGMREGGGGVLWLW